MFTLFFSALAAGVVALGYSQQRQPAWALAWLGGLFIVFVIIRCAAFYRSHPGLCAAYEEQLQRYTSAYGNTSIGQHFLNRVPPLLNKGFGLKVSWGACSGHWIPAIFATFTALVSKPTEQQVAEHLVTETLREVNYCKSNFSASIVLTSAAYAAAAVAAFSNLDAGHDAKVSPTTPVAPQLLTVAEAEKIAVQRYPALGSAGSKFNIAFVSRYNLYQKTRPDFFKDSSWPLQLANEVAHMQTPAPSPAASAHSRISN